MIQPTNQLKINVHTARIENQDRAIAFLGERGVPEWVF